MFTIENGVNSVVASTIESVYKRGLRVRVWYGDVKTGEAWPETYDVVGKIGRSTGVKKIPLLLKNASSTGGGALLVSNIVRIDSTDGRTLYKHEKFSHGEWKAQGNEVYYNGELFAKVKSNKSAVNFCMFMIGSRYCK